MNFLSRLKFRSNKVREETKEEEFIKWHKNSVIFKTAEDRYRQILYDYFVDIIRAFLMKPTPINLLLIRPKGFCDSDYIPIKFIKGDNLYSFGILWKELTGIIVNIIKKNCPYDWSILYNITQNTYNTIIIQFSHDTYDHDPVYGVSEIEDTILFSVPMPGIFIQGVFINE
jgi:hypothetical protein